MRMVLVTGGTGLLGRAVAKQLASTGAGVRILTQTNSSPPSTGMQLLHGDQTHVDTLPSGGDQVLQSLTLGAVSVAADALTVLAFRHPVTQDPSAARMPAPAGRRRS